MDTRVIYLGVILFIGISACERQKDEKNPLDTFSIIYVKGSSWTDYSYKAVINQNGSLGIEVKVGINDYNRISDYQISKDNMALIKNELIAAAKMDFENCYGFGSDKPFDLPVTFIKYIMEYKTDSTYIYFPEDNELPEPLESFLVVVEQIISDNDTISN